MPLINHQHHVDDRHSSKKCDQGSRDSTLGSLEADGIASANFEGFSRSSIETTETLELHTIKELDLQNVFNELQALKEDEDISNIPSELLDIVFNNNNFNIANLENDHNTTGKDGDSPIVVHCTEQVTNDLFENSQESQEYENILEYFLNDYNLTAVNLENNPCTSIECTETPNDHADYVLKDLFVKSIMSKDCENITGCPSVPVDLLNTYNFNTAISENCPNTIDESNEAFEQVLDNACVIIDELKECESITGCPSELIDLLDTYIFKPEIYPKTLEKPAETYVNGAEHDILNLLCAVSQESKECEDISDTPSELFDVLNFNKFETVDSKNNHNTIMEQADMQSEVHGAENSSKALFDISQESMECESISDAPSGVLDFVNIRNLKSVNSLKNTNPITDCIETLNRLDENKVLKGRANISNTHRSEPSEQFDLNDYILIKQKKNHNSTEGCGAEIKNHKQILALENQYRVNECTAPKENVTIFNVSCTKKLLTTNPRENHQGAKQPQKKTITWTIEATKMLIDRIKQSKSDFENANLHQKSLLWKEVSKSLQANNHNYCASKCNEKWRTLKKRFMNIKNDSGKSAWPLFELVQDALTPSEKEKIISLLKDAQSSQEQSKPRTQITNQLNPGKQEPLLKKIVFDDSKKLVPSKRKAVNPDET